MDDEVDALEDEITTKATAASLDPPRVAVGPAALDPLEPPVLERDADTREWLLEWLVVPLITPLASSCGRIGVGPCASRWPHHGTSV